MAMARSLVAPEGVPRHRQVIRTRSAPPSSITTKNNNEGEDEKPRRFSKSVKGDMRYETKIESQETDR